MSSPSESPKWLSLERAIAQRRHWAAEGRIVVFTNGCFDILHAGHVSYLNEAKKLGHRLIVGLNSDQSIQTIKGTQRPIIPQTERALLLAALTMIDMVVIFDETTPIALIQKLQPDIHAKGGDYIAEKLPEYATVQGYGGTVRILPFISGLSSSKIIEKIRNLPSKSA